jgi:6-methylsalicylate decarboxylase
MISVPDRQHHISRFEAPRPAAPRGGALDVHQHLWPEPLVAALARRREAPRLLRRRDGWVLRAAGEPEWPFDPRDHDAAVRAAEAAAIGVGLAIVAPSSPVGAEALPPDEAAELADAYHRGVADLPAPFLGWATAGVREPDPRDLAARLEEGFVGLCLPAGALAGPADVERLAPLLEVLEHRRRPLFVHPGPGPEGSGPAPEAGSPPWWTAMVPYVAGQTAAWWAFAAHVRPAFPRLRACFAMLAGLAPLHLERLEARGGAMAPDPDVFLDTSSYGPRACAAVALVCGESQLVPGSDRPVVAGAPPSAADHRRAANARRLLAHPEAR